MELNFEVNVFEVSLVDGVLPNIPIKQFEKLTGKMLKYVVSDDHNIVETICKLPPLIEFFTVQTILKEDVKEPFDLIGLAKEAVFVVRENIDKKVQEILDKECSFVLKIVRTPLVFIPIKCSPEKKFEITAFTNIAIAGFK